MYESVASHLTSFKRWRARAEQFSAYRDRGSLALPVSLILPTFICVLTPPLVAHPVPWPRGGKSNLSG